MLPTSLAPWHRIIIIKVSVVNVTKLVFRTARNTYCNCTATANEYPLGLAASLLGAAAMVFDRFFFLDFWKLASMLSIS